MIGAADGLVLISSNCCCLRLDDKTVDFNSDKQSSNLKTICAFNPSSKKGDVSRNLSNVLYLFSKTLFLKQQESNLGLFTGISPNV